jgi:hypothetical protein
VIVSMVLAAALPGVSWPGDLPTYGLDWWPWPWPPSCWGPLGPGALPMTLTAALAVIVVMTATMSLSVSMLVSPPVISPVGFYVNLPVNLHITLPGALLGALPVTLPVALPVTLFVTLFVILFVTLPVALPVALTVAGMSTCHQVILPVTRLFPILPIAVSVPDISTPLPGSQYHILPLSSFLLIQPSPPLLAYDAHRKPIQYHILKFTLLSHFPSIHFSFPLTLFPLITPCLW